MITSRQAADSLRENAPVIFGPAIQAGHIIMAQGGVKTIQPEQEWQVHSNGHTYKVTAGTKAWHCTCEQGEKFGPSHPDGFLWLQGRICKHIAAAAIQWMTGAPELGRATDLFEVVRRVVEQQAVYVEPGQTSIIYKKLALALVTTPLGEELALKWGRVQSERLTRHEGGLWFLQPDARFWYDKFVAEVKSKEG